MRFALLLGVMALGVAIGWPTALGGSSPPDTFPGCAAPVDPDPFAITWSPAAPPLPTYSPKAPGGPYTAMLIAALRRESWQPHWAWNAMVDPAFRVRGNPTVLQLVGRVMFCESRFNRWARGDPPGPTGLSRGLYQIHRGFWPEVSDAQAFNPAWAIRWAVPKLLGVGGSPYLWSCFRERLILQ